MRRLSRLGLIAAAISIAGCSGKGSGSDLFSDASTSTTSDSGGSSTTQGDSGSSAKTTSAMVLDIRTDMKTPSELDSIRLEVIQGGTTQFGSDFPVGTVGNLLPASFTLCASDALCNGVTAGSLAPGKIVILDPASLFTVRLIGSRRGQALTLRIARTSLPPNRTAMLRLIAEAACKGQVQTDNGQVTSTCATDESCIAGACAPIDIDSTTLPSAP